MNSSPGASKKIRNKIKRKKKVESSADDGGLALSGLSVILNEVSCDE